MGFSSWNHYHVRSTSCNKPTMHETAAVTAACTLMTGTSRVCCLQMGVTAPLLLETADAFESAGLRDAGYIYINTDDGWLDFNRTASGELHPSAHFTNDSMNTLTDALHKKHFKFGIYGAAGYTTCGHRAGGLYHERQDAATYKAWGVDYLK